MPTEAAELLVELREQIDLLLNRMLERAGRLAEGGGGMRPSTAMPGPGGDFGADGEREAVGALIRSILTLLEDATMVALPPPPWPVKLKLSRKVSRKTRSRARSRKGKRSRTAAGAKVRI